MRDLVVIEESAKAGAMLLTSGEHQWAGGSSPGRWAALKEGAMRSTLPG